MNVKVTALRFLPPLLAPLALAAPLGPAPTLRGTVQDWDGQPGLIALLEVSTARGPYNLASNAVIDARGEFALSLPDGGVASLLGSARQALGIGANGCRDEVRVMPAGLRAGLFTVALHQGADHLGVLQHLSSDRLPIQVGSLNTRLVYADRAASLTGAVSCPDGHVERWHVQLARGWNWVLLRATRGQAGTPDFDVTSAAVPDSVGWYRYGKVGALDVLIDDLLEVTDLSPALARLGLRKGDRLLAIDGESLEQNPPREEDLLAPGEPGTTVALTLDRQGKIVRLTAPREVTRFTWQ